MRIRIQPWLLAALLIAIAVLALLTVRGLRAPGRIAVLRDSLEILRIGAVNCRAELDEGSASLEAYTEQLDSVRARIRELEAIDPRGVPADSYDIYLETFDVYNDSVARWSDRADALRARLADCRETTAAHNALVDSLRRLLVEPRARGTGR